jgi:predicted  nucleic acid-binding Zn-ribbon protein
MGRGAATEEQLPTMKDQSSQALEAASQALSSLDEAISALETTKDKLRGAGLHGEAGEIRSVSKKISEEKERVKKIQTKLRVISTDPEGYFARRREDKKFKREHYRGEV